MNEKKIQFIMLVGLPHSGKSDWAKTQNMTIHSAGELRKKLFGDTNNKDNNPEVFAQLYQNMLTDLSAGKDIIFDATNLTIDNRKTCLDKLKNLSNYDEIEKTAVIMATKFGKCLGRNNKQPNPIKKQIMHNLYHSYQKPTFDEDFDRILYFHEGELKPAKI